MNISNELHGLITPPHSVEAEQAVLGSLMLGVPIEDVSSVVTDNDFYLYQHKIIFAAMFKVAASGNQIDLISVHEQLESSGGNVDLSYLAEIAKNTPSTSNCASYCKIIKKKSLERAIILAGRQFYEIAIADQPESEKIAQAQNLALSLGSSSGSEESSTLNECLKVFLDDLEERNQTKTFSGIKTNYSGIDTILRGLRGGHFHIIAGRPGSGKTTFALNVLVNTIFDNHGALFFSLEMPKNELTQRIISAAGKISHEAMDSGDLNNQDWEKLSAAVTKLKDKNLFVIDKPGLTIQRIRSISRFKKKSNDIKIVFIDYIGLIRTPNAKNSNRNNELGEISRQLKEMAKELDVPVICLAQLNREVEKRGDKRPKLSDLRDSGEIEQDADTVTFLWVPEDGPVRNCTIAKNRHGKTGEFSMTLYGDFYKFEEIQYQGQKSDKHWSERG